MNVPNQHGTPSAHKCDLSLIPPRNSERGGGGCVRWKVSLSVVWEPQEPAGKRGAELGGDPSTRTSDGGLPWRPLRRDESVGSDALFQQSRSERQEPPMAWETTATCLLSPCVRACACHIVSPPGTLGRTPGLPRHFTALKNVLTEDKFLVAWKHASLPNTRRLLSSRVLFGTVPDREVGQSPSPPRGLGRSRRGR